MCMEKQKLKRAALFYEKIIFVLFEFITQNSLKLKCKMYPWKSYIITGRRMEIALQLRPCILEDFFFWGGGQALRMY